MSDHRTAALAYARENRQRFIDDLKEYVAIPSVSTDPEYRGEIEHAAAWTAERLRSAGVDNVQVMPTKGAPVVYGGLLKAGPEAKTVLIYGHYDVQPAEPLDKWSSAPFKPEIRNDNLYGRGATDMKGQVTATINAIEAILKTGELPVNVKFMIEGEEEIGSPNLESFIASHKELLTCDLFLNPDTGMLAPDLPTITYALRGLAYFEIRLRGPQSDLHSGVFGGVVHNPAQVLCELIAGMHDTDGRVTLPGFYNRVRELDAEERRELARLPLTEADYLAQTGAPVLWSGEKGYTPVERAGARPTLEVHGILSGFTGSGAKTVLPAAAMAKISTRLVPDQDPAEVYQQLLAYMEANAPKTVQWDVEVVTSGSAASIIDRHSAGVEALSAAMEAVWGKRPVFKREGGSVPVVTQMQQLLGIEAVNTGFSLQDDNMHGPDEKLRLPVWSKGTEALIHFFFNYR